METMKREKKALLREIKKNESQYASLLNKKNLETSKSSETSEAFRKSGNTLFLQKGHSAKTHRQIFDYYCQSVMTAPNSSDQLACAYGNRSAFLLHIKKYEDCIKDCNRALKITDSDIFKVKMLCRKAECLKKLRLSEFQNVLQEAEKYIREQFENDDHNKKLLNETVQKVKALSVSDKISLVKKENVNQVESLDEILDGIKIEYNQKSGKHLIATKDYKPGDIILVENLFATTISENVSHTNCHYCLKICWSGVPCKLCDLAIFCSEDCRHRAWKLFHDIECPLFFFLQLTKNDTWHLYTLYDTVIRAIIIGIKQAGSIAQLKADLKSISKKGTDKCSAGFIRDGEYTKNRIESVFVLNTDRVPDDVLEAMSMCAITIVSGIAQYSQLLTNVDLRDFNRFMQNEDVIFLGTLIIKILAVKSINDYTFGLKHLYACEKSDHSMQCNHNSCCDIGSCFSPISSLVRHSCYPNASKCFTEDRQVILYAVQPIEKNTQIFNSFCDEFDVKPIEERKLSLQKRGITCDCQACVESWPPILYLSDELLELYDYGISSPLESKIFDKSKPILNALNEMKIDFSKKDISKLSKSIVQSSKLKQPSKVMCYLVDAMKRVFSHVYGLKQQLNSFGICN